MNNSKKIKPANIVMDCIIAGVVLVLLIVVSTSFFGKDDDTSDTAKKQSTSTALPAALQQGDGIENYECVIADDSTNDTVFYVSFDTNSMTFEETLSAGEESSTIDKGSYEEKDGSYITTSESSNKTNTYVKDGEYLIVASELYEGEVPDTDTFDASFVYEVEDEVKTTVTFKKDGTYTQEVVSYAAGDDSENTTKTTAGTYEKEDGFIRRTAEDGEPLLDFYIYNNQLSNAYYKLIV